MVRDESLMGMYLALSRFNDEETFDMILSKNDYFRDHPNFEWVQLFGETDLFGNLKLEFSVQLQQFHLLVL